MTLDFQTSAEPTLGGCDYPDWQTRSPTAQSHWDRQVAGVQNAVRRPKFDARSIAVAAMLNGATNDEVCDLVWRLGLSITQGIVSHYRTNLRRAGYDVALDGEIKKARCNAF